VGLGIEMQGRDAVPTVVLRGELDIHTAPELVRWADEHLVQTPALVVELDQVDLLDSSGLGALVRLTQGGGERRVVVVCRSGAVRRVVELTQLAGRLALTHDRESAMLRLASPSAEAASARQAIEPAAP
jgi:anti-anti-sigma factor